MFFLTENWVFVSFFMSPNMRFRDPCTDITAFIIWCIRLIVFRMILSQNHSLRNFQLKFFFDFFRYYASSAQLYLNIIRYYFFIVRRYDTSPKGLFFHSTSFRIEKWIQINGKKNIEFNPPSLIPNFYFDIKTTRPYWLLQRNRNHLSLVKNAHLHFYTIFSLALWMDTKENDFSVLFCLCRFFYNFFSLRTVDKHSRCVYEKRGERTLKQYIFYLIYLFSVGIPDSGSKKGRKCRRRKGATQKLIVEKRLDLPGKDSYKTITIIGLSHKNRFLLLIFFSLFFQIILQKKKILIPKGKAAEMLQLRFFVHKEENCVAKWKFFFSVHCTNFHSVSLFQTSLLIIDRNETSKFESRKQ